MFRSRARSLPFALCSLFGFFGFRNRGRFNGVRMYVSVLSFIFIPLHIAPMATAAAFFIHFPKPCPSPTLSRDVCHHSRAPLSPSPRDGESKGNLTRGQSDDVCTWLGRFLVLNSPSSFLLFLTTAHLARQYTRGQLSSLPLSFPPSRCFSVAPSLPRSNPTPPFLLLVTVMGPFITATSALACNGHNPRLFWIQFRPS